MTVNYRYIATRLGGDRGKLAELHLNGVKYQRLRNGSGAFNATLKLLPPEDEYNRRLNAIYKDATDRGTTCTYVLRNNVPMAAYINWTRDYHSDSQTLDIGGFELFSYLRRRIIEDPNSVLGLDGLVTYDGLLMYDVVNHMISQVNDIGLVLDVEAGGPVMPTLTPEVAGGAPEIPGTQFRGVDGKWVADIVTEWANQEDGFDFRTDLALTDGIFQRRFLLRQSLGNKIDVVAKFGGVVAKAGGNVVKFDVEQSDLRTNDAISLGSTSVVEGKRYSGRATDTSFVPKLTSVYQQSEETDTTRLDAYAEAALAANKGHEVISLEVAADDVDAAVGTFNPGDEFRFMVAKHRDAFYPDGLDTTVRTIGFTITPGDTESKEMIEFHLEESPLT